MRYHQGNIKKLMKQFYLLFFVYIFNGSFLFAQEASEKVNDGDILSAGIAYGINFPGGDLKDRYGENLHFSVFGKHITKANFLYGIDFTFMFGNDVKEDVLKNFRTPEGFYLGSGGLGTDVFLRQRGLTLTAMTGKIFPLKAGNRSGIKAAIGAGILQHNIRFLDDNNAIAQLGGDLRRGYDRMSRGFTLRQELGYVILSKNRRLNFDFSFVFFQGFTKEIRPVNFDTGLPSNASRLDLGFGLQLAWILPFYINSSETVYY
ncbi:MAG: hypothetical protein IPN10_15225 [Saprospiraceae bacterium]|nr:hypothetical protein [Saprospiraceae bacterium]MBP6694479.1 hypothetical protein [Saprospiraceae bacterium]